MFDLAMDGDLMKGQEDAKDSMEVEEEVGVSLSYSLSQTRTWMPISTISDFGFDILTFTGDLFHVNPNPISKANGGAHEQTSSLVSTFRIARIGRSLVVLTCSPPVSSVPALLTFTRVPTTSDGSAYEGTP